VLVCNVFWCFVDFSVQLIHLLIIVLLIHQKKKKILLLFNVIMKEINNISKPFLKARTFIRD